MVVSLPPELLGAILAEVRSTSDLLQLRLTNTTLNELATPLAFKSVCLENRNNNIKCFKLIAKSRLAPHVREVVFQYVEEVTDVESHVSPEYGPRGYDGKAFVEALCNLTYFPALESLVLHFRENDGPFKSDTRGNPNDREFPSEVILQFLVFKALSDQPPGFLPPLKSLTVDKYLPLPNPSITSESIKALLGNLDHLAIKTTTQCEAFPMTDPRVEVYGNPVFKRDFLPASLVSLELHHAYVRSAYMTIPLKHVHLPRLERLSLQRSQFSEQDELEAFIIRHGTTLVELKLFLCPMALSTSTSSKRPKRFRRWAQVWDRLSVELKVLGNLVVSERHDAMGVEDDGVPRYVDNCYYCNEVKLAEAEIVEDEKALERFRKKVEARLPQ